MVLYVIKLDLHFMLCKVLYKVNYCALFWVSRMKWISVDTGNIWSRRQRLCPSLQQRRNWDGSNLMRYMSTYTCKTHKLCYLLLISIWDHLRGVVYFTVLVDTDTNACCTALKWVYFWLVLGFSSEKGCHYIILSQWRLSLLQLTAVFLLITAPVREL